MGRLQPLLLEQAFVSSDYLTKAGSTACNLGIVGSSAPPSLAGTGRAAAISCSSSILGQPTDYTLRDQACGGLEVAP